MAHLVREAVFAKYNDASTIVLQGEVCYRIKCHASNEGKMQATWPKTDPKQRTCIKTVRA
jgi:hypothetical protein